jgi:hypothetical protein
MNPELQRQLWLRVSVARLALIPALLGVVAVAIYLSTDTAKGFYAGLVTLGISGFSLLVFLMGVPAAGASVTDEITEQTWDQQRMSAMSPWAMLWGKLAGATAYNWYGGLMCGLVAVLAFVAHDSSARNVTSTIISAILVGLFLQTLLLALNLQLVKLGGKGARRGGVLGLLLLAIMAASPIMRFLHLGSDTVWWGITFDLDNFMPLSLLIFFVFALIGAWRSMAEVLAVRQWPWGWPALALGLAAYFTGFFESNRMLVFCTVGFVVCTGLTYMSLLTEPQPKPLWQKVLSCAARGQWRLALQQLPRWPTTWLLAAVLVLLSMLFDPSRYVTPASSNPWSQGFGFDGFAALLLMARDACLALFFAFAPRNRRAIWAFLLSMLVLYALLPWLFWGPEHLRIWALPVFAKGGEALLAAAVHLAVALALLRWRWKR